MEGEEGDLVGAGGAAGDAVEVVGEEEDDLAETQRHDGQVVAAKPQGRDAQDDAEEHREDDGEGNGEEGVEVDVKGRWRRQGPGHPRGGVSADGVEGDVAQVQQPGETRDDVQTDGEQDVDGDLLDDVGLPGLRGDDVGQRQGEGHQDDVLAVAPRAQPVESAGHRHHLGRGAGHGGTGLLGGAPGPSQRAQGVHHDSQHHRQQHCHYYWN